MLFLFSVAAEQHPQQAETHVFLRVLCTALERQLSTLLAL